MHSINGHTIKDRLVEILVTAEQLHVDAERLQTEAADLFSALKDIDQEPGAPDISTALDAAAWLDHAAANVQDEFCVLIAHVHEAVAA